MAEPIAYFLTWTTYATWLHGDDRLSVDRHRNRPGSSFIPPDQRHRTWSRSNAQGEPVVLSQEERRVLHRAIETCAARRGWKMLALNVRTNHVHCIVQASARTPERVMNDFKVWGTRSLRDAGLRGPQERIWTRHGSTRWINDEAGLLAAMEYVLNEQ